jgi:hypothetical protein
MIAVATQTQVGINRSQFLSKHGRFSHLFVTFSQHRTCDGETIYPNSRIAFLLLSPFLRLCIEEGRVCSESANSSQKIK